MEKISTKVLQTALLVILVLYTCSGVCLANGEILEIKNDSDFFNFSRRVNDGESFKKCTVILKADIDMHCISENFHPLVTQWRPFCGTFKGEGHRINLYVNEPVRRDVGLFGCVREATICNLNIYGKIIGGENVGAVAGSASKSSICNCHNYAEVGGNAAVVGIVGESYFTNLDDCSNNGKIFGFVYVGYLVGTKEAYLPV